jgi:glutathione peroxidase
MRRAFLGLIPALLLTVPTAPGAAGGTPQGAHAFELRAIDGGPLPLATFRGRPILVVNTASLCGYTYQYDALVELDRRYRARGLVVLGVPSGDFGGQELADAAAIRTFCETRFDVEFPLADKTTVRGAGAHPLFAWLAHELGPGAAPRWNFHKWLIDADGRAVATWPTGIEPLDPRVTRAIEAALPAG